MCQESAPALKDNIFVMATFRTENDYLGKWWRLSYTEIFKRLGMKIEIRDYPKKRVSIEADAGNVDGECGRVLSYAAEHPNLIRVEESLLYSNFSAFTAQDSIPALKGWDSLKGTDYRVEYQRGTVTCEDKLPKVVKKENLSVITEQIHALKKLVSGRTDLFVDEESGVLTLLQTPEFKDSKIRSVGVMESFPIYPYLNKKHALLAPKMAEIIKAVKAEGLIEQYRMMVEKEFGVVRK
jgi:ABC-type amino acid transport substrate-binding protein